MKLIQNYCLLALIALFGSGCTPYMVININAIADKNLSSAGSKYVFSSDMADVNEHDLYFQEYSRYFDLVLKNKGFTKVSKVDEADIVIKLKYAVSDGRNNIRSYRFPRYEHIGGYSYPITIVNTDAAGNVTTTTKTVHIPLRTVYAGSDTEFRSYTLYNRTATLRAVIPAKENQAAKPDKVVWHTQIFSVSESNDLRQAMPYFAYAASNFLGQNSGQQQMIELELKDPGVTALKAKY